MDNKGTTALRKRTQIAKTNKLVFIWVAIASVVTSVAIVLVIVMVQKAIHTQKAISELRGTVATLRENNEKVPQLEDQVRALGSNDALLALRTNKSDNALRVILDALPAEPNPSALGASLQNKLFDKISVESVQVMPLSSDIALAEDVGAVDPSGVEAIDFQFIVRGDAKDLKALLERLQRSIRTVEITDLKMESENKKQKLTVRGQAYYLPAYQLKLVNKDIAP